MAGAEQIVGGVLVVDLQVKDDAMAVEQVLHRLCQPGGQGVGIDGDGDGAVALVAAAWIEQPQIFLQLAYLAVVVEQRQAGLGGLGRGGAPQQHLAILLLEEAHPLRHRTLGDVQLTGGLLEAAVQDDHGESLDIAIFEHVITDANE
jgi:hypothetical protein